jgi:hypothetical protein
MQIAWIILFAVENPFKYVTWHMTLLKDKIKSSSIETS